MTVCIGTMALRQDMTMRYTVRYRENRVTYLCKARSYWVGQMPQYEPLWVPEGYIVNGTFSTGDREICVSYVNTHAPTDYISFTYTQIVMQVQSAPEGAWLVPTAPYDAVFSGNLGNYHRVTALMILLFTVLILAPMGSRERQNGMTALLRSTGGRERLRWKKHLRLLPISGQ